MRGGEKEPLVELGLASGNRSKEAQPRRLFGPWVSVCGAILVLASAGSAYAYSIYSAQFASRLGFSEDQVQLIGTGECVGLR